MLAQVKKLVPDDFQGRFGAWWNGREYTPPAEADTAAISSDDARTDNAATPPAPARDAPPEFDPSAELFDEQSDSQSPPNAGLLTDSRLSSSGAGARLLALETLWSDGRFNPGSRELDAALLDEALARADGPGDIGFIGADGALLRASILRSDRTVRAAEWRVACVDRLRELAPQAQIHAADIDRPRGFEDGSMAALISIEAFAYADHKAGLVSRAFRALNDTGRWVFLDTTRQTNKTPAAAFASAWAEPQLSTADEIEELLVLGGFKSVRRVNATDMVLAAARQGFENLASVLEATAAGAMSGRGGAQFLQELAWEAQSWRARTRALEGGALNVDIWIADKAASPDSAAPTGGFDEQAADLTVPDPLDQLVG